MYFYRPLGHPLTTPYPLKTFKLETQGQNIVTLLEAFRSFNAKLKNSEGKTIFEVATPRNISYQFSLDHIIHLDQFFS